MRDVRCIHLAAGGGATWTSSIVVRHITINDRFDFSAQFSGGEWISMTASVHLAVRESTNDQRWPIDWPRLSRQEPIPATSLKNTTQTG